jgi:uncharacterized protein YegJ (DUF2314 family)
MTVKETFAWHFRTELPWREDLKTRLDPVSRAPWVMCDSDRLQDSITNKITEHAWLKIFEYNKGYFVANLTVEADQLDFVRQLEQAKRRVFDEIFSAVGAHDVGESKPIEG